MPQYKRNQYGLKQYGLFQTKPGGGGGPGKNKKWTFIRSRFGYVRKNNTFWLYTHTPISVSGPVSKLRIKANNENWIQEESIQLKGVKSKVRLSSNQTKEWLVCQNLNN